MSVDDDTNTWSRRLARYGGMSVAVSGLGLRLAQNRLFSDDSADDAARLIAETLGQLKGPAVKVAQFLSTIPDALPPAYMDAFSTLQSAAPPMGRLFVRRRMASAFGGGWRDLFASFEEEASFAASLGQVHRGVLKDGQRVAVKIQYPNMDAIVAADLQQLKLALSLYERWGKALRTEEVFEEIKNRLQEELDYQREARHIALFQGILKDQPHVNIPQVITPLSTRHVLTMSFLAGDPLKDCLNRSPNDRNHMARLMFDAWYRPLYHYGVLHGDPHLGNYTFAKDGGVNLFDFGCIRVFTATTLQGVIELYRALQTGDQDRAHYAYTLWGFEGLSRDMMAALNTWANLLYEPLLDDRVRPIDEHHSGIRGRETAYRLHAELARLGGVTPPRAFVFMDRAAVGLGSVFMRLQAAINWHQAFERLIDGFCIDTLHTRQQDILAQAGLGDYSP